MSIGNKVLMGVTLLCGLMTTGVVWAAWNSGIEGIIIDAVWAVGMFGILVVMNILVWGEL